MNEAILKSALKETLMQELALLPDEKELSKLFSISARYDRKIRKIIRNTEKATVHILGVKMRPALVVAAIVMLLFTGCMTIQPIREQVIKFFMNITPIYSEIKFSKPSSEYADIEFTYDLPTPPKGYEVTVENKAPEWHNVQYDNKDGDFVRYTKSVAENSTLQINTEGVTTTDIYINGCLGLKYSNQGISTIVWTDEKGLYTLDGTCEMGILEKMALSIK